MESSIVPRTITPPDVLDFERLADFSKKLADETSC